jgi:hypothetical protein
MQTECDGPRPASMSERVRRRQQAVIAGFGARGVPAHPRAPNIAIKAIIVVRAAQVLVGTRQAGTSSYELSVDNHDSDALDEVVGETALVPRLLDWLATAAGVVRPGA